MKIFIKELLLSILLTVLLIFIVSLLMSKTSLSDNLILPLLIGVTSFSLLFGAYRISKNKKEKGILNGLSLGISYMVILYFVSSIISFDFSISINSLIMIFCGIIFGILGGIIGVNF